MKIRFKNKFKIKYLLNDKTKGEKKKIKKMKKLPTGGGVRCL
jgi:hypothetical protein